MRNLKFVIIGLVIGGLILAIGAQFFLREDLPENAEREQLTEVSLLSYSQLEKNSATLVAYGTVEAVQDQDLIFEMTGMVEEVYAGPGDWVEAGQALAKLDDEAMATTVAQAEAAYKAAYNSYEVVEGGASYYDFQTAENSLEMAEIQLEALYEAKEEAEEAEEAYDGEIDELDDVSELLNSTVASYSAPSDAQIEIQELMVEQYQYAILSMEKGVSDETLAAQWAYVEQAEAGLAAARAAYDSVYLRAPFDGEITTLPLYEGQYVFATYSVGKIVNRDDIEAVTYLSTEDAEQISTKNTAVIEGEYEGYVFGISTRVDDYNGKLKVRIQMDGIGGLVVGDTVKIEIAVDKAEDVILVPLSSLLFDEEDAYIFFYHDGKVYKRLVDAGDVLGDYVEVHNMPEMRIVEDVAGLRSGQEANVVL
jgi:RND family efflux transporter MFP subunit